LTDGGATTLHKHDHGSMDDLSHDDHPQYALVNGSRNFTGTERFEKDINVSGSGVFENGLYVNGQIHGEKRTVRFVMDNGSSEISTGLINAQVKLPYAINLSEWSILATPSGNIELDILMGNPTSLPPTESITGSEQPYVTGDRYNSSTLLTGWTDTIPEDKVLDVNVVSCSGVTKCFLDLYGVEV